MRAFTPHDQKAVKTAAETLRPNPTIDITRAIMELAVGEALVSMLDSMGSGLGRAILRGALGSILGGSTGRSR